MQDQGEKLIIIDVLLRNVALLIKDKFVIKFGFCKVLQNIF